MLLCVSTGLQEYVEAVSFYYYLKDGMLVTLSQVEKDLKFSRSSATEIAQQKPSTDLKNPATVLSSTSESCTSSVPAPSSDKSPTGGSVLADSAAEVSSSSDGVMKVDSKEPADRHVDGTISVTVPPMEFMLGIADLTGELMRTAIMSVSAGNLDYPVQICDFMRIIHDSFMSYGNTARELTRKMATLSEKTISSFQSFSMAQAILLLFNREKGCTPIPYRHYAAQRWWPGVPELDDQLPLPFP